MSQQTACTITAIGTALGIHAVSAGRTHEEIATAGAVSIITTDSIAHRSNAIGLAEALADAMVRNLPKPGLAAGQDRNRNQHNQGLGPKT